MRHPTNGPRPRRAHSAFIAGGVASVLLCLAVAATEAAPASALPSGCVQAALTVTCTYTAGVNEFDVPKGVSSIHVVAIGGAGGSAVFASGGFGAKAAGDFAVSPGQSLFAVVGANGFGGGGGYNGGGGAADSDSGGGGGASDLRTTADDPASRLLVAGGGGGGGFTNPGLTGGGGGNAGEAGDDGVTDPSIGGDAGRGGTAGTSSAPGSGGAGGAGQTAGCDGDPGGLGAQSNGGAGGTHFGGPDCAGGGGGGGGGYYGGGGGGGGGTDATGTVGSSGGGGGGSSLVPAGGTLATDSTGVPEITISYTVPDSVSPTSIDFGSQAVGSSSAPQVVTLRNTGAASIYVTSVSKAGANPGDFTTSADTCTGTTIAPGDNCTPNPGRDEVRGLVDDSRRLHVAWLGRNDGHDQLHARRPFGERFGAHQRDPQDRLDLQRRHGRAGRPGGEHCHAGPKPGKQRRFDQHVREEEVGTKTTPRRRRKEPANALEDEKVETT